MPSAPASVPSTSLKERQKLYEELHGLGLRMAPLERRLAATVATR
jgi:hypothetical protein